jgi:hypothetical protein
MRNSQIQLPAALLDQRWLGYDLSSIGFAAEQIDDVEQLPEGDAAADGVLPIVSGVIPAARHIKTIRRCPSWVEAGGLRSVPGRNCVIASIG